MYKVYFDNRVIVFSTHYEGINSKDEQVSYCKNKKSFDNAYDIFINTPAIAQFFIITENPKKLFKYLKQKFIIIKAAGGLVLNTKGELLAIKRNNYWDLPKGKIEKGEKKKVAAIREVEEECGISGLEIMEKIAETYHTYLLKNKMIFKTTYWYKMLYAGNQLLVPQVEEGIIEAKWIDKNGIPEITEQTFESLKPLFTSVLTGNKY